MKLDGLSEQARSRLLSPFRVGDLTVSNRVVMAPMSRRFAVDWTLDQRHADYYSRRAELGVGLIVTEATYVDHESAGEDPTVPRLGARRADAGWGRVVESVHEVGGKIWLQLFHVGARLSAHRGSALYARFPHAPSGLGLAGEVVGEPMTRSEIDSVVGAFERGARLAREVGFDGVEIHAAHGYLIDQFFWDRTNRRTDRFGGSPASRARFAAEVVHRCRGAVGQGFPISIRVSQWKVDHYDATVASSREELRELMCPVVEAGADIIDVSTRRYWEPAFGGGLTLAGEMKEASGLPTIAVGSVGVSKQFSPGKSAAETAFGASLEPLSARVEAEEFDLLAVGRSLIVRPQFVADLRSGLAPEVFDLAAQASLR